MTSNKTPTDTPPLIFNGKLFSGNGNPELAKNIAKYLGVSLSSAEVGVLLMVKLVWLLRKTSENKTVISSNQQDHPILVRQMICLWNCVL